MKLCLYTGVVVLCALAGARASQTSFGPFRALLYSSYITCDHDKSQNKDVSGVQVFFYDFRNNFNISSPVAAAAATITAAYSLDVTRTLVVFVPGYKSHISKNTEELIRQTFQNVPDVYLIILDHSVYTSAQGGRIKSYERSVSYVHSIGRAIGDLLVGFSRRGFPASNVRAIGHSLGAQMLAVTGEVFLNRTTVRLPRITGVDPAGPCFSNSFIGDQIRSGVAEYVEVYHCNAGGLGTTSVLADADFFFNHDGSKQPACRAGIVPGLGESAAAKCSHKACVRYYALTVHHPNWYLATKCVSYKAYSKGLCAGNEVTIAGYYNPGNATGVFYVSTDGYEV